MSLPFGVALRLLPDMDGLIARFDAIDDGDLVICSKRGVAYQRDMKVRVPDGVNAEGNNYFDHYAAFEGAEIGCRLHEGRVDFVNRHVGPECQVLDIGIGSGEFIKARPNTRGMDVNPKAVKWLEQNSLLAESVNEFTAFTFWDVLEHIDRPQRHYFRHMPDDCYLFTSLPIFDDLKIIRRSKHYKPGEHLYYWTEQGFVDWMASYRFRLVERSGFESEAGRESILSFAFKRDLPGYHQTVDQYRMMYQPNYGASAYLYFDQVAAEVRRLNPGSILDFGCGRSDLVAHFWNEGRRRISKYDPAIPQFEVMPEGQFDLVVCCDVMEHILMEDVQQIFHSIRKKSGNALFTISMKLARAKLPDGRNAHVTLLSASEWTRWVKSVFGRAERIPVHDDQILMLRTF